jgi:DNA-binding HxlR family transcriptional regulator
MEKHTSAVLLDYTHDDLRRALTIVAGKWKLEILWLLHHRAHRFGELKRAIPGVTQHMLTSQLRELESDGLITREVFAEVPPKVVYEITTAAQALEPSIVSILSWWRDHGSRAQRRAKASKFAGRR